MENNNLEKNNENLANSKLEETSDKEKSFLSCYLSGLKYGIVFGLAIVVGLAIVRNNNENKVVQNTNTQTTIASDTVNIASSTSDLKNK